MIAGLPADYVGTGKYIRVLSVRAWTKRWCATLVQLLGVIPQVGDATYCMCREPCDHESP